MSWLYKAAYSKYLNHDMFDRPGFPSWADKIKEINAHRDVIRAKADKMCEANGHTMFPWTCMNSTLCRKCGCTVYLHNIHGHSDGPDIEGRASTDKCFVKFDTKHEFEEYKHQDYHGDTVI